METQSTDYFSLLFNETYILTGLVIACALYIFRDTLFPAQSKPIQSDKSKITKPKETRNIIEKMEQTQSNVVIFFGSQTGTAEDYANRLSKEGKQRFGLTCLVADIENYDMDVLDTFPSDYFIIFVISTYGEGEPTDNANEFYHMVVGQEEAMFSAGLLTHDEKPLRSLRYSMFGLGNRTYEYFNAASIRIDAALTAFGAQRVGDLGLGDDDASLEDDFINWKEVAWENICSVMDVKFVEAANQITVSTLKIHEYSHETVKPEELHTGELYDKAVINNGQIVYDTKNPFIAPVKATRELYKGGDRSCIHLEVDLANSGIQYTTGDHIGIWATNPEDQVQMFAKAFDIESKLDNVISIDSLDIRQTKKPFPSPTTYSSLLRYYADICSSPSRQFLGQLVPYVKSQPALEWLKPLANDPDRYQAEILNCRFTSAEVYLKIQQLEQEVEAENRSTIPLNLTLENLGRLMPRYYSISSSNLVNPTTVHVTASILEFSPVNDPTRKVKGLFTNFLAAAHRLLTGAPSDASYTFNNLQSEGTLALNLPVYIRKSNFRLPRAVEVPVIMIGPGTGVAPFRGFIQERAYQSQQGKEVGPTELFFGCRHPDQDFMYQDELETQIASIPNSKLHTAFSRQGPNKVYVQHLLKEHSERIWELIHTKQASIYVCGDAKYMAKDVNNAFVDMAVELGKMSNEEANAYVKKLRAQSRYQEDVWS